MLLRMEVLKTRFNVTLIASLLIAANASAQVSNVEGIQPMDGVEIPKVKKSQSQSINSIRIGFINTDQLFKLTGKAKNKESIEFLNAKVKSFAEKFKIGLVLQEAVYINPKADITQILSFYIQDKFISNDFAAKLPTANYSFMRFVNVDKIFKESEISIKAQKILEDEFKNRENELASFSNKSSPIFIKRKEEFQNDLERRKNEERQKVLTISNEKIKKLSLEMNIDLILQEAVYISPELDVTDRILSMK
jgi:outer membrane protein